MGGKRSVKRSRKTQKRLKRSQKRLKRRTQKRSKRSINRTNKRGGAFYHRVFDRKDVNCYIADIFKKFIDRESKKDISNRRVPVLPEFTTYTDIFSLYNLIYYSQNYRKYLGIDETKWIMKYKDKLWNEILKIRNIFGDEVSDVLTHNINFVRSQEPELNWDIQGEKTFTLYNVEFFIPSWLQDNYGDIEGRTGSDILSIYLNYLKNNLDDWCGFSGTKNILQHKMVYRKDAPEFSDSMILTYRDNYFSIFFIQRMKLFF
tara:strand:+ start:54 stop:833 length:780 start_codon:yes stop_codon:yes gene_type:complete